MKPALSVQGSTISGRLPSPLPPDQPDLHEQEAELLERRMTPMLACVARDMLVRPVPAPERVATAVEGVSARITQEALHKSACLVSVRQDLARPVAERLKSVGYRAVLLCNMAGPTGFIEVEWHRARLSTGPVEEQYCPLLRRLWLSLTVPVSG